MPAFQDLSGARFGRLTVVSRMPNRNTPNTRWMCRCECGKEKDILAGSLKNGDATSCGCLQKEAARVRFTTHGKSKTSTWFCYHAMKKRCLNPNDTHFIYYGGRGIKICERWLASFANFLADMGERPRDLTIERKDVNGDYTPENCCWADAIAQQNNKRDTQRFPFNGEMLTIPEISRQTGIRSKTIFARIFVLKWPIGKAFTKPAQRTGR